MIWIIGGVSETALLLNKLAPDTQYTVTVATEMGKECLPDEPAIVGRMSTHEMVEFIRTHQIQLCVDLSHPYAEEVSVQAKQACAENSVDYLRYNRPKTSIVSTHYFVSFEECVDFLKTVTGCVFFTTGSKNISDFEAIRGNNRFIYRILPAQPSLDACKENDVALKDIIAMLGPFSQEFNCSMFQEYQADYVVMKDSGKSGGTQEKILACQQLGIMPLIIGRPELPNEISDLDELLQLIQEKQLNQKSYDL